MGQKLSKKEAEGVLRWYAAAGVRDVPGEMPVNAYEAAPPPQPPAPQAPPPPPEEEAPPVAQPVITATTLEDLRAELEAYEGCALKKTARNLVFADGNPDSGVMFLGEAPGADEDKEGKPFVGKAGKLLDNMLAAIGLDREKAYISNMIFWRPPGNRTPLPEERAQCWPFVERHVALVKPRVLVLLGAVAAHAVLPQRDGVTKLRGRWFEAELGGLKVPALVMLHPAYLLRQPGQKALAWRDLLSLQEKLAETEGEEK